MITKLILTTALVMGVAHGSADNTLFTNPDATIWNPSIAKKVSGKSCDDGNCITDLNCMTKDGRVYKFFTSLRDKVKKQCKL